MRASRPSRHFRGCLTDSKTLDTFLKDLPASMVSVIKSIDTVEVKTKETLEVIYRALHKGNGIWLALYDTRFFIIPEEFPEEPKEPSPYDGDMPEE